ncbi:MAG: hypothetical protein H6R10_3711 [Rhodocyclaceae bacterium]|nr:hypothetical protein [Rhodocyclaceae bacterium]
MRLWRPSQRTSLLYQASIRLLRTLVVAIVVVGLLLGTILHYSQEKAAQREIRNTQAYFSEGARTMERRWQETAVRYKSRLEFMRLLEDPATRWPRLGSYLTTQNTSEPFPAVLVADARGRVLFSFGFDEGAVPATFANGPEVGWHYDPASDTLHRYYVQHVWLGPDGMGHLVLFRPMDNGLLSEFATLNTHLFLRWQGRVLASSLGERGKDVHLLDQAGAMEHDGMRVQQAASKWDERNPDSPELVIHLQTESLFDIWEVTLGTALGLLGIFAALGASIGIWIYQTTRRIALLGEASRQFALAPHASPEVGELLEKARRAADDEINRVAFSLESLTATVAQRNTERDAYEATLRESEAKLREIASVLADGVYVLDEDGVVTFVNREAERLLGWSADELIGKNGHGTFHYKTPDGTPIGSQDCIVHQTIRTGQTYRNHNDWLLRKDGSIVPVSIVSSPIVRDGKIRGSVAAFHDITPRLEAERALRESEERFRLISTAAMDAIVIAAPDSRIVYWNPAAERLFGYPVEEALGQPLHALIAPRRYHGEADGGFEHFRRTGEGPVVGKTIELMARCKNDGEVSVELSLSAFQIDGQWHALGMVRDISERKLAEHAMRENKARMRALLDASSESVLLLEPEGGILAVNALGAQRFGQTPEEMVGKNFFDFQPPELADGRRAAIRHVATTGEPMRVQDRRGDVFFDSSLYPVKDESGNVEGIAIYAKDVSEQRRDKQVEEIFRHLDTMLLKWRMDVAAIAQTFCESSLAALDLAAAWIGQAEKDGSVRMVASAAPPGDHFLDHLTELGLRWDGGPTCCLPMGEAIRSGQRQITSTHSPACRSCRAAQPTAAEAILLLPLSLSGETWGILALYGRRPGQFDDTSFQLRLAAIANRLGVSLESAQQQEWVTLLYSALAGVSNAVLITDAQAKIIWTNRAFEGLSGYTATELLGKTPGVLRSGVHDADFYQRFWETLKAGKTWQGEIVNLRRDGSRYTANQTVTPLPNPSGEISHYVAIVEDVSERKAMEAKIQHSANFDLLTDLPNRGLFFDRLGQALARARRERRSGALLFLDLDRFKQVNDQLGHAAGDKLLIAVAERLRHEVRESDTVARLAGDEFTIILNRLADPQGAILVAEKILAAIIRPLDIGGQEVRVGVSIGIAFFPEHGDDIETILNAADHAMYRAKESGRNRYALASADAAPPLAGATAVIDAPAHDR